MRHRYRLWVIVLATFFVAVGLTLLRGDGRRPISIMPNAQADENPAAENPADGGDSHSPGAERDD